MSNEFPAFIKAEYVEGDAFSRFQRDVSQTLGGARQQFERSFTEIGNVISKAISRPAGAGKIDIGLPDFRQAAADARVYQASVEATFNSAKTLARLTGDLSEETRSYIRALNAQTGEARQAVAEADAQVASYTRLQTALNATADANSRLAQAQRAAFSEQARAAQIEVQQRQRQAGINEVFAPGLTRSAVDNGAGFGALEVLARQQAEAEQAAAAMLRLRQAEVGAAEGARILAAALQGTALEAGHTSKNARESAAVFEAAAQAQERAAAEMLSLQRAEAGAAEGARLLAAALQGTALAADRTTKSARESAAVFEAAFAAQERSANEAAAAQKILATSAAALRAELDPMFAAQQRFNTALDRADELLKAGAISTREYEQAQVQARQQLQAHAQSLFAVEAAQGRDTSATRINTESQRANRFAMIQAGQQLQDITISLQSGQRATTVFAQQLPQLAFAFTDVGGKVGAFAQVLAGPWGVAVFGAVSALGFFIEHLITAGDESDDLGRASLTLSQALDKERLATEEGLQALKDFNAEKERARSADALAIDDSIRKAEARRREALATREALQAELERQRALQDVSSSIDDSIRVRQPVIRRTEDAITANQTLIDELNKSLSNLGIDKATQDAKALADPIEAINQRYDRMTDFAKRAASANRLLAGTLRDTLAGLERQRGAEIDATRERERASKKNSTDPGETTRFLSPISGAQSAPFGQQRGNRRHAGIDIAAPVGSAVRAPAAGTIIEIGNDPGGYGNYVIINHGRGTKTRYAHLLQTTRSKGSAVSAGEVFAQSGGARGAPGAGNSRGPHLHYEVLRNGKAVDPMKGLFPTDSLNVAREAEQTLDQLAGRIQNLQDRFDPATKAANDFAEALQTIKDAQGAGLISEGKSLDLQIAAMAQQAGELNRIQNEAAERFMKVFEPQQMRSAADEWSDVVEDRWAAAQSGAANAFVDALTAVDFLSALLKGRASPLDLLRTINPGDSRLRTGVGASGSGIDKFLFGKQSNFREVAEGKPEVQPGFVQAYTRGINEFQDAMRMALESVLGKNAANIGETLGSIFANGQIGSQFAGITGGNRTAGAVGGVLGSELGKTLASGPLGKALGSLSSALGPLGGIVGGIALGALGSALTPAKRGSATIGGSGGNLVVSSTRGNSKSRIAQSTDSADEAITTLERIAEALGGSVDASRGSVSIGVRDKSFRVDTSGSGITKTKKGAIDFGQDSAAAIKFATMDLIKDGVITGLRASTQRLLQNSKDLDSAIQKAVDFQSVFDRLQARVDPVGAAITGLDREFSRLRSIFGEAAASAEELADLEKLYTLEREEAVKEANERVMGSMKALLDDLRFGDNGRSLRDRLAAAQAKFDPLAARVQSGDITAYDDFAEAARTLLDIQRQFSGSQTAFFDLQDKITAITAKVVEGGNVTSILPGSGSSAQADAQRAYDGSNVVDAISDLKNTLVQVLGGELRAINDNTTGGPAYSGSGGGLNVPGMFAQNVRQI